MDPVNAFLDRFSPSEFLVQFLEALGIKKEVGLALLGQEEFDELAKDFSSIT